MPHIQLEAHLPGITGLLEYRKDTGDPIREVTQIILRGPSGLSFSERELIAALVSHRNHCNFCSAAHDSVANYLTGDPELLSAVKENSETAPISEKMKSLLSIAAQTQMGGLNVTPEAVQRAKQAGATDMDIHDTVFIAALFCLYNKYVDGLATAMPQSETYFQELASRIAVSYLRSPKGYDHLKK